MQPDAPPAVWLRTQGKPDALHRGAEVATLRRCAQQRGAQERGAEERDIDRVTGLNRVTGTGRGRLILRLGLLLATAAVVAGLAVWLWPSVTGLQSDLSQLHVMIETARDWRDRNSALAALLFLVTFALAGTLPLPVVTALTLAGGAFFGFWAGLALSVAGTTISATLSFLIARHVLYRPLRRWLGLRADALDRAVARNGAMALLSLRVTPALPFFLINMAAGISRMRLAVFAPITAIGVLPNKAILTLAGTGLSEIDEVADIFSPRLVAILLALAVVPWLARWIMRRFDPAPTGPNGTSDPSIRMGRAPKS